MENLSRGGLSEERRAVEAVEILASLTTILPSRLKMSALEDPEGLKVDQRTKEALRLETQT